MIRTRSTSWFAVVLAAFCISVAAEEPTPLSLPEAVRTTLANNPLHKAALADAKASAAGVREAKAPSVPKGTMREPVLGSSGPVRQHAELEGAGPGEVFEFCRE